MAALALIAQQVALRRARGRLDFADMHLPDTPPRVLYAWLRELWQGYKLPCASAQRGGACRWAGTSGSNTAAGKELAAAEPPGFQEWLWYHLGTSNAAMLRCGWSFRGIFAASAAAIRRQPPSLYAHLRDELGKAAFPVAGMYMERAWRRLLLCAPARAAGSLPWEQR